MKKLILASVSALALLGVAACSDSGKSGATTRPPNRRGHRQPNRSPPRLTTRRAR